MSKLILKKLDEIKPCGEDLKYDDAYLFIEQEVDKAYSVSQDEATNWEIIQDKTEILLMNSTKDFKIASWWLISKWKLQNWVGLESGLEVFNELLTQYKTELFPKSPKAKKNALIWMEEILTQDIVEKKLYKETVPLSSNLLQCIEELQTFIEEIFEDKTGYFGKIVRYLKQIQDKQKSFEQQKTASSQTQQAPASIKKMDVSHEINENISKEELPKTLQIFRKAASALNQYYKTQSIGSLQSIRITRLLAWLNIDALPFSEEAITFMNPPSEITLSSITEALEEKEYEKAFTLIEKTIERAPFWLDGHILSYETLLEMGEKQAAAEVKNALISFIHSYEGVLDLKFKDETPFASEETLAAIHKFTQNNINAKEANTQSEQHQNNVLHSYKTLNKKEALQVLQQEYNIATTQQDKFNLRYLHAKLAIEQKEFNLALILLEDLENDITRFNLDQWQPELSVKVYVLLIKNFQGKQNGKEMVYKAYEKLCKLDITQALKFKLGAK